MLIETQFIVLLHFTLKPWAITNKGLSACNNQLFYAFFNADMPFASMDEQRKLNLGSLYKQWFPQQWFPGIDDSILFAVMSAIASASLDVFWIRTQYGSRRVRSGTSCCQSGRFIYSLYQPWSTSLSLHAPEINMAALAFFFFPWHAHKRPLNVVVYYWIKVEKNSTLCLKAAV